MYVRPVRNRLPGLRGYRWRRGLGTIAPVITPGGPVDIGTSAVVTVTPTTTTITPTGGTPVTVPTPGDSGGLTDWLNSNSSTLLWVGGIGLGVLLLARLAR